MTVSATGPVGDPTATMTRRDALIAGAALLVVAILGLTRLADPFHGDQSLFLQDGEARRSAGAVVMTVELGRSLTTAELDELEAEADRLAPFVAPDSTRELVVVRPARA